MNVYSVKTASDIMTSNYVRPDDIYKRYETHHKKLLTLYVTRQNQDFVVANDITLCDLELIRSSVELVGEPGFAGGSAQIGFGHVQGAYAPDAAAGTLDVQMPNYLTTVNQLYAMNLSGSSTVKGATSPNAIQHKTALNHGWINIEIEGMSQNRHFMRDYRQDDNELSIVVPTDCGLLPVRMAQQNGPPRSMILENIKLEQTIRIKSQFAGSASKQSRTARFVEDFADTDITTYRSADGSVKYYAESGLGPCQIPSNMVNCMILQFQMTPRSTV
jgi:hypothetical protein